MNKIIRNIFSFANSNNAKYLSVNLNEEKIKFNFYLPFDKQKTLSLPNRYKNEFFKNFKQFLKIKEDELILKKQISIKINKDRDIKLNLSVIPEKNKEKIIIEFSRKPILKMRLSQLGLKRKDLNYLKKALKKKQGLIILSGKEQSGKSTTMFSCLSYLNSENKNIILTGDNINTCPPGVLHVSNKSQSLNYLKKYQADVIAIDDIKSKIELGEAFKLASYGHLVIVSINSSSPNNLAKIINQSPWPKQEKLANLNFVSYQELETINTNTSLTEINNNPALKEKRKQIARYKILYLNNNL